MFNSGGVNIVWKVGWSGCEKKVELNTLPWKRVTSGKKGEVWGDKKDDNVRELGVKKIGNSKVKQKKLAPKQVNK